jgi:6-phosphofructokinase 1
LGHLQRGGDPSCADRVLASEMGVGAIEGLLSGKAGHMVGVVNGKVKYTPILEALKEKRNLNDNLVKISKILSI